MTQEELNSFITGNFDEIADDKKESEINQFDTNHYRVDAESQWPPPPPTDDHKVVHQLDDVTKGLEIKATQVFDQLETISTHAEEISKDCKKIKENIESQKALFEKLTKQFPNIVAFKTALQTCDDTIKRALSINDKSQECGDCSLQAMDIMQYQDIHRQKIERVVNIMRTLAKYLNSMFETNVEDDKRVTSATYLEGDTKDDVISDNEIEDLIKSMGKK